MHMHLNGSPAVCSFPIIVVAYADIATMEVKDNIIAKSMVEHQVPQLPLPSGKFYATVFTSD